MAMMQIKNSVTQFLTALRVKCNKRPKKPRMGSENPHLFHSDIFKNLTAQKKQYFFSPSNNTVQPLVGLVVRAINGLHCLRCNVISTYWIVYSIKRMQQEECWTLFIVVLNAFVHLFTYSTSNCKTLFRYLVLRYLEMGEPSGVNILDFFCVAQSEMHILIIKLIF